MSGKLIDKEQTLEEEIQLRERLQLQCKQAERTVDDLQMELQTTVQAKDDLAKQLKQAHVFPSLDISITAKVSQSDCLYCLVRFQKWMLLGRKVAPGP